MKATEQEMVGRGADFCSCGEELVDGWEWSDCPECKELYDESFRQAMSAHCICCGQTFDTRQGGFELDDGEGVCQSCEETKAAQNAALLSEVRHAA